MPPRKPASSGFTRPAPSSDGGPRVNEQIRVNKVRLIGAGGEQLGILNIREAQQAADDLGLDLVEISPNAEPPVCKILDYGKFKYEQQKKAAEARKKQKVVDVKEIKIRPTIEEHDYQVKLRNARRFLEEGDKVKVVLRFRGREMAHLDLGMEVLMRFKNDLSDVGKVEAEPKMEGRQAMMLMGPGASK